MEYLLKASAVVFLFYLCYSLFLKKETFFQHNRWFLLIGITTALVFPLVVIPVEIMVEPTVIPETAFYIENTNPTTITQTEQSFQWQNVLPIVYLAGLVLFLIQFMLQFGSLILLLFKNPKTKDGIYTYIIVKSKVSPFSFFKWIVYNPELFEEEELQLILKHEKVHVRQLHSIDIVLTRLACVIFWFNPIMWMYKNQVHQNLEYIADDETQNATENDKDYQHLLVKTSVANQHMPITTNFYNSLIKKRIIMLNKSRSKQAKLWKSLLVLPLLTALLLSVNTKDIYVETDPANTSVSHFQPNTNENSVGDPSTLEKNADEAIKEIEVIFKNTMSNSDLEKITSMLKENGVTMTIEDLDRNDNGKISSIRVSFTTELSTANYGVTDPSGIQPFVFKMNNTGGIKVGSTDQKNVWVAKEKGKGKNTFTITTEEDEEHHNDDGELHFIDKDDDENVFYLKNGDAKVKTSANGNYAYVIADTIKMKDEIKKSYWIDRNDGKKDLNAIQRDNVKIITQSSTSEPLYIINGKRVDKSQLRILDPKRIDSMSVLKGDNATKIYGKAGENGVVIINADSISNYSFKTKNSPWKVRTAVSSVEFIDDENPSENGFSYYVSKNTTDKQFGVYKSKLESRGIKVKFSKIKRNSAGEITSIKISLTDESGSKASATWRDDEETIPKILVGKKGGKLRVSSSTF
ncbi:M56 family metallopeptidase [Winogradskyella sp. A3E31]|uniref:M56 family metallopeptidase n=1 Tax=Winogradskyella sp. A3E31 TaxID=3349637 RepID=UPI00398AFCCC